MLDSDTNAAASFSAVNGEYAFRLTVTDSMDLLLLMRLP